MMVIMTYISQSSDFASYEGRSSNTRKNTATLLSLFQGLQVHTTKQNDYCQIFMLEIIDFDFNAVISPQWLLWQR